MKKRDKYGRFIEEEAARTAKKVRKQVERERPKRIVPVESEWESESGKGKEEGEAARLMEKNLSSLKKNFKTLAINQNRNNATPH